MTTFGTQWLHLASEVSFKRDNRKETKSLWSPENEAVCIKLRFGTYPRDPPFFGPYRGHYPIVEFEIWPFQPRVKLSLSTMRPLIDIFSRCSCNVALARFVLFLALSLSLSSARFLPPSPSYHPFFSIRHPFSSLSLSQDLLA